MWRPRTTSPGLQRATRACRVLGVSNVTTGVQLFALNTSRPTFSDVMNRRAAALALDRTALSGVLGWQAHDQFISPLLPGYANSDVYPLNGNPAAAASILAAATPAVTLCHPGGATGSGRGGRGDTARGGGVPGNANWSGADATGRLSVHLEPGQLRHGALRVGARLPGPVADPAGAVLRRQFLELLRSSTTLRTTPGSTPQP